MSLYPHTSIIPPKRYFMKIIRLLILFFLVSTCNADDNLTNTELKEKVTAVLEYKDGIAFAPDENVPFTGKYVKLYPNKQKEVESNFINGKINGLGEIWYENGQKNAETNYKDNKKDGLQIIWNENGQKSSETTYKDGEVNGLQTAWRENGMKILEATYKDGNENGLSTYWHENGIKAMEKNYVNGKENGMKTIWHENGHKLSETNYIDGKKNGMSIFWNENGQKLGEIIYKKGKVIKTISYAEKNLMQEIIARCRTQMGEYGAAMVKACVDQDIKAENALRQY